MNKFFLILFFLFLLQEPSNRFPPSGSLTLAAPFTDGNRSLKFRFILFSQQDPKDKVQEIKEAMQSIKLASPPPAWVMQAMKSLFSLYYNFHHFFRLERLDGTTQISYADRVDQKGILLSLYSNYLYFFC